MGRIAQSLIATLRDQAEPLKQVAEQFTEGLPEDMPSPEVLDDEGYDPQHILYIGPFKPDAFDKQKATLNMRHWSK